MALAGKAVQRQRQEVPQAGLVCTQRNDPVRDSILYGEQAETMAGAETHKAGVPVGSCRYLAPVQYPSRKRQNVAGMAAWCARQAPEAGGRHPRMQVPGGGRRRREICWC